MLPAALPAGVAPAQPLLPHPQPPAPQAAPQHEAQPLPPPGAQPAPPPPAAYFAALALEAAPVAAAVLPLYVAHQVADAGAARAARARRDAVRRSAARAFAHVDAATAAPPAAAPAAALAVAAPAAALAAAPQPAPTVADIMRALNRLWCGAAAWLRPVAVPNVVRQVCVRC